MYHKELGFFNLKGIEVHATELNAKDLVFEIECDHCGKLIKGKYISACDCFNCESVWGVSCFKNNAEKIDLGYSAERFFKEA